MEEEIIKLDKGEAILVSNKCVNSDWKARFLAEEKVKHYKQMMALKK